MFWATGNPSPSNRGEGRAGDNLYSNTLLVLNPDTGKLNWHFQFTKHDEHDWDATQVPILIDAGDRHLIAQANRNGFFYVLERSTGKLLSATTYGHITWSDKKDAEGRPVAKPEASPTPAGHTVCPGALGSTNWMSPSYDSQTGLFYVTARDQCESSARPHSPTRPAMPTTAAPTETSACASVGQSPRWKHLQGNIAVKLQIMGTVDHTHAARADLLEHAIVPSTCPIPREGKTTGQKW